MDASIEIKRNVIAFKRKSSKSFIDNKVNFMTQSMVVSPNNRIDDSRDKFNPNTGTFPNINSKKIKSGSRNKNYMNASMDNSINVVPLNMHNTSTFTSIDTPIRQGLFKPHFRPKSDLKFTKILETKDDPSSIQRKPLFYNRELNYPVKVFSKVCLGHFTAILELTKLMRTSIES
jgi:hypothetical protein